MRIGPRRAYRDLTQGTSLERCVTKAEEAERLGCALNHSLTLTYLTPQTRYTTERAETREDRLPSPFRRPTVGDSVETVTQRGRDEQCSSISSYRPASIRQSL